MRIEIGPNEAGQRLDKFLRKYLKDVPLSAIFKSLRKGDVRVNGAKGKEKMFVEVGDVIEIKYMYSNAPKEKKKVYDVEPEFKVTFEDDNILMVEKWPGILVHKDNEGVDPTLTDQVLTYLFRKGEYNPEEEMTFSPSPVNRLDRNTSGIVIYAKNYEALKTLNEMMRDGRIVKNYMAIVKGRIKDGEYRAYIEKREDNNVSSVSDTPGPMKKEIAMTVRTEESTGQFSLVELNLLTGRSHQLRAHLASLGNPIIGDKKYGEKEINNYLANKYELHFQYLYAYKVTFKNPDGKLEYLGNKVVAEKLPPLFKKVKTDLFKFDL
ncbi:RluA family pseudouridine synthase [Proteiniclasticum sp.]|uniref:RluA family pseudouridine synthase n=1 Tax=Proteiniclasticum sp. TaxID=2053595 RepID=UPI0028A08503|nr:RluA family pseudouridine synthase [Proteiniclasticum sp.]